MISLVYYTIRKKNIAHDNRRFLALRQKAETTDLAPLRSPTMIVHPRAHAHAHACTLSLAPAVAAAAGSRLATGDRRLSILLSDSHHHFVSIGLLN